jgi:hypothetical protein
MRSFRFTSARDIESARQFLNDPTFRAAQIGMRIAGTSDSPSDAGRQTSSFLRTVMDELAAALDRIKCGRKQAPDKSQDRAKEIDKAIDHIKAQAQKLEEIMTKIEQLLPKMMAALGDDSKEPCNPTPQLVAVRTAELERIVAKIEWAVESSIYPLPPDLDRLVRKFRPVLRAVPVLFRHSVPH